MQNLNRVVHLPKDESFFVFLNHLGKICFLQDLKVGNIAFVSLLRETNPQMIYKLLHIQSFLPASIPAQTIFITCFNPQINNLCSAPFIFQVSYSLCFKSTINHLSYQSQPLHRQSFLPATIPRKAILDTSAVFHLSVFIQVKITSRYRATNCSLFM